MNKPTPVFRSAVALGVKAQQSILAGKTTKATVAHVYI